MFNIYGFYDFYDLMDMFERISDKPPHIRKPRPSKKVRYIQKLIYAAVMMYISGVPP